MHFLDYMIIALLGYNGFIGLRQGAIRMINGILGIIVATSLSKTIFEMTFPTISTFIPFFIAYPFVYFGGCFLILIILCQAIAHFIHTIFKWSGMGILNHSAGLLLGSLRGLIIALIFIIPLMIMNPDFAMQSSLIVNYSSFILILIDYLNKTGFIEHLFQSISLESLLTQEGMKP
ncbi:hypothetical protein CL658_01810 [bacterium]|nr:hypothetical protein [bacterium]|tara:strand:- start:978 stop:1505 length:528 start_codon:yes stop_codon:yes gene_type:complete